MCSFMCYASVLSKCAFVVDVASFYLLLPPAATPLFARSCVSERFDIVARNELRPNDVPGLSRTEMDVSSKYGEC